MIAIFKPSKLSGSISAPPSKSMAHRYLIGAALSGEICTLSGIDFSEDILASIDCLKSLGCKITIHTNTISIDPQNFMQLDHIKKVPVLECRESGSTMRFFLPLALCLGTSVTLKGSQRLLERPFDVYEKLCHENHFSFEKLKDNITVCGNLRNGSYELRGDISSQFITGIIFALLYLGKESLICIIPPFESRSYVNLTVSALRFFGANIEFVDDYTIAIKESNLHSYCGKIEGDYSNAAFLDVFNEIGSNVNVHNLLNDSLQGDKVYKEYFRQISKGTPTLDISDCPDLGPVLFALASMKNGAVFTGTDRLKVKESDRGLAMHEELKKLGGGLIFEDNTITVPKHDLTYKDIILNGHNDHRIVMAMSVILTKIGGVIDGIEAVRKSYPGYFEDLKSLGAQIDIK